MKSVGEGHQHLGGTRNRKCSKVRGVGLTDGNFPGLLVLDEPLDDPIIQNAGVRGGG